MAKDEWSCWGVGYQTGVVNERYKFVPYLCYPLTILYNIKTLKIQYIYNFYNNSNPILIISF